MYLVPIGELDLEKIHYSNDGNRMLKSISSVLICTIIFKLLGFCRELVLSYEFGTSGISDAYLISQTIPSTLFEFVGVGLTTCYIPIYYKIQEEKGREKAFQFTNKITTIIVSFATLLILLVWLITPLFIQLFASGFEGSTFFYAKWFTRIGILSLYFSTFTFVYSSFLQANNIFFPSSFSAIMQSIFILITIIIASHLNIWILSIGSTLSVGFKLLFLLRPVNKCGLKSKLDFKWHNKYIFNFIHMMIPVILGTSVNEFNTLIDRTIASLIVVGGISALNYANSLVQLVNGGLVQSVATVFYPKITKSVAAKDFHKAKNDMRFILSIILSILVPISFGISLFNRQIITILFARGAFDDNAVNLASTAFLFYGLGLCFIGIREMLSRYYYAYGDTKTPMINATVGVFINIFMNLLFSRYIGIGGLALATSLSAFVTSLLLFLNIRRKLGFEASNIFNFIDFFKTLISSIIMSFFSYHIYYNLPFGIFYNLLISIALAVLVYLLMCFILKAEVCCIIKNITIIIITKLKKRN